MKKILSILIATVMLLSTISCLSVGALRDSTADEATDVDVNTDVDPDVISREFEVGSVSVCLKNDSPSVEELLAGFDIVESRVVMEFSDQTTCYYVKFAEETEEIVWEAIAVLEESPYVIYAEPNYFAYVDPVEPSVTEAPTQAVSVTQPNATTSADLKSSTSDTAKTTPATSDTVINQNSNGTVQTGQSNLAILLTLLLVVSAAATALFFRFRYCD